MFGGISPHPRPFSPLGRRESSPSSGKAPLPSGGLTPSRRSVRVSESYDRIAGYFRSSLFEIAGEALASVAESVRIVCNSDLDPQDLATATAGQAALRRSWCAGKPEDAPPETRPCYQALYEALTDQRIAVLMALDDPEGGPILVLAPKPLLQQWQDELMERLRLPSARWNGRAWVDENDLEYPGDWAKSLGKCPRRIGLVVRRLPEALNQLPPRAIPSM